MIKKKPWVYIAGPYSQGDPVQNTRRAIEVADRIVEYGVVPIVPHVSLLWDLTKPRPPEFWYEYTMQLLARCDAIYRIPGDSWGADREMEYAGANNMTRITGFWTLLEWCLIHGVREGE